MGRIAWNKLRIAPIPFVALEQANLTTNEKLLIGIIASYGEKAFPFVRTLMALSSLGRRAVLEAIKGLAAKGWLEVVHRTDARGHRTSSLYDLGIPEHLLQRVAAKVRQRDLGPSPADARAPAEPLLSEADTKPSDLKREKKQESAETAPPATQVFQELAVKIITDHDALYPNGKLLASAKARIFREAKKLCAEMLAEWGREHIEGMWEEFKYAQKKAGRAVNPFWFFRAQTIQETHDEQIKYEENNKR